MTNYISICCRGPAWINTLEGFVSTFHAWISQKNWCIFTMFFETNYTNHGWILNLLKWAMHDECSRMGDLFDWSSYQVIENLLYPVILAITKWRTKMLPLGHLGLSGDHSLGAWDIRDSPIEPRKKPSDTFHWILVVNRDPYNGLLSSPSYNCVV